MWQEDAGEQLPGESLVCTGYDPFRVSNQSKYQEKIDYDLCEIHTKKIVLSKILSSLYFCRRKYSSVFVMFFKATEEKHFSRLNQCSFVVFQLARFYFV